VSPPRPPEVLALHPGALGDVLQAVPALAGLRALEGGRRVTVAGQPRIARLLADVGAADDALSFDGLGLEHLFGGGPLPDRLRSRLLSFDHVVSWFGAHRDPYPERLRALVPAALIAPPVPAGPGTVWEHLAATLQPWGVVAPAAFRALELPAAWRTDAEQTLARLGAERGRPLLAVHPGAGGAAKRWPVEKLADAIRSVEGVAGVQVLVHQGPADHAPAMALATKLAALSPPIRAPLLIEPPLGLLAAVLRGAAAYLGADSGVSHLAAAVGAPAVILFAPAARERWAPWNPAARAVDVTSGAADVALAAEALTALLRPRPRAGLTTPQAGDPA